jgi:hypothetical protein
VVNKRHTLYMILRYNPLPLSALGTPKGCMESEYPPYTITPKGLSGGGVGTVE